MNTKNATPERGENDATAPHAREEADHERDKINSSPEGEKRVAESDRKPAKKAVRHVRHRPLL